MGDVSFEKERTSKKCDSESEDESSSSSDRSQSVDADEGICLTSGDRADSGIDVSLLVRPNSLQRSKHQQKCSAHTSQHPKSTGLALFAGKQLFCEKLIATQISALLRSVDKVHLSRHDSPDQRRRSPSEVSTIMFGGLVTQIPRNFPHAQKVYTGCDHQSGGSRGPHRKANGRSYKSQLAPMDNDDDDEDDVRAPEHDGDLGNPSGNNAVGRYPCIYHRAGYVDPTPGCWWLRRYTSQLKTHHFHHDHPHGPFGCCSKCFMTGFTTKESLQDHETNCRDNICIDESCDSYGQLLADQGCRHRPFDRSQMQIWSMWYRIAHRLSRFQPVPDLPDPSPQQLLPPSGTHTPLARTRSSPGSARPQAVLRATPAPQRNEELIAHPSPYTPAASSSTASAPVISIRDTLIRLVAELLQRLRTNPFEPEAGLAQLYEETLELSADLQKHADPEYGASIKLLRSLAAECWRLLTNQAERTPNAWSSLRLRVSITLVDTMHLPAEPPDSWGHQSENLPPSSASSSLNGLGTVFGSYMDLGTQRQQHQLHNHQQPRQPAYNTAMDNPAVNMAIPTFTLTDSFDAMQSAGSSAFQSTNLGVHNGMWPNMNSSNPPWDPLQMSRGNLSNPAYGLPQPAQNPPPTSPNSSFLYGTQAHFHPNQTYMPDGSVSTDWDVVSRADSAAYSGTLSNSFNYGERGNQNGKGKGPANDGTGGATSSRYGRGDL